MFSWITSCIGDKLWMVGGPGTLGQASKCGWRPSAGDPSGGLGFFVMPCCCKEQLYLSLCDVGCPSVAGPPFPHPTFIFGNFFFSKLFFTQFSFSPDFHFLHISGCSMPEWVGEARHDTMLPSILVYTKNIVGVSGVWIEWAELNQWVGGALQSFSVGGTWCPVCFDTQIQGNRKCKGDLVQGLSGSNRSWWLETKRRWMVLPETHNVKRCRAKLLAQRISCSAGLI